MDGACLRRDAHKIGPVCQPDFRCWGILSVMAREPLHSDPIPFITLPNWVKAATYCGFNIQPIFHDLGIQTDLVHLESATVERPVLEQLMERCIGRARQHHFPFVLGETFAFEYLPDLETFLTTSPTLREATRIFDWVRELINPMLRVRLEEDGETANLIVELGDNDSKLPGKPYFTETMFAAILKFGRMLVGESPQLHCLRFRHLPPAYAQAYHDFFRIPIHFGQSLHALEMDRKLLDQALEGGFPALHQQAEYRVEQRLSRLSKRPGLVTAIEDAFSQDPQMLGQGIEPMAAALNIHSRTLQRRLREAGHSYAELQARVRYRLAMQYLEQTQDDLESISERLGFSDRRSFTRAFARWSGVSPSSFRTRGRRS
jgi:AraC-like DNA-binding protein